MRADRPILVVEDEERIRDMYSKYFGRAGHDIRTAASAEEALEVMQQDPCRVLIVDMELPGLSGLEFGHVVRRKWPLAIAIAVTGYGSLFHLTDCRDAGFDDYYLKPAGMEDLLKTVERALEKCERWLALPRD